MTRSVSSPRAARTARGRVARALLRRGEPTSELAAGRSFLHDDQDATLAA